MSATSAADPSAAAAVWVLVAVLLSLVVALVAALLQTRDGVSTARIFMSAGAAFAVAMGVCLPSLNAVGLV